MEERPVWTGILWAGGMALIVGVVTVIVSSVDMLLSSDYTQRSIFGGVADALYKHGLFSFLVNGQDWSYLSECSSFGPQWLVFTLGFYYLVGRRFLEASARHKCVLGFMIAFPIASLAVGGVAVFVLFCLGYMLTVR